MIRAILITLCALFAPACVATTGELERAVTEITGRIDVAAREAQESAEAAREAWRRGEITYTELQARLQDIRSATLDVAKETTQEVVEGVKEAIRERPGEAIETGAQVVGGLLPGPWGDIVAALGGAAAAAMYARKKAHEEAVAASARLAAERDAARQRRGEPTT